VRLLGDGTYIENIHWVQSDPEFGNLLRQIRAVVNCCACSCAFHSVLSKARVRAVALALVVRGRSGQRVIDAVVAAIADRNLLLLVDNCEHVITAVAQLSEALLSGCPALRILATSREPLRVPGEAVMRVPPMPARNRHRDDSGVASRGGLHQAVRRTGSGETI
jgi:hypothetical protein